MIAALVFGLAAGLATLAGGGLALALGRRISMILGLSAGVVMGLALFDLLPEAISVAPTWRPRDLLAVFAAGVVAYMVLDRLAPSVKRAGSGARASLGAASLTLHSLLDGLGIGLAFQVSSGVGLVVATAVLAHDLSDGANTVSLSLALSGAGDRRLARRWLAADAAAPLAGVLLSGVVHVSRAHFAPLLAAFGGAFLYIGAVELLPTSYRQYPTAWTTLSTAAGLGAMYLLARATG